MYLAFNFHPTPPCSIPRSSCGCAIRCAS
jgi:hypothetical protein